MERLINFIYKLRYFSCLIAFFIGGVFYSITCHAEAAPELALSTFNLIQGGAQDLFVMGFTSNNLLPYSDLSFSDYYQTAWDVGYTTLVSFDNDDIELVELDTDYKTALLEFGNIYDSYGRALTPNDKLYIGTVDNGFFSGSFYVDETGTILCDDPSLQNRLFNLKFGGYIKDTVEWMQMYDDISADIFNNSYVLPFDNDFDITERSFYLWYGLSLGRNRTEAYIFVPDVYDVGTCVLSDYTQGRAPSFIYYTDDANITVKLIRDNRNQYLPVAAYRIENGSWLIGSSPTPYTHRIAISPYYVYSNSDSNIDTFNSNNDLGNQKSWNFSQTQFVYDTSLLDNSKYVAFKQLQFQDSASKVLNFNDTFDYNELKQLLENLNNLQPTVNNEFNYGQPINEYNYYNYTYVTEENKLPNSNLPLPGSNNNPLPDYSPSLSYPYPDLNPNDITNGIPIISGLQYKFPFSIPWDIYNLIKGLSAQREAPHLEFSITFPVINYTWEPTIDLSMYNSTAELLRTLLLILFIIGLAVFSYNHFFGT